MENNLTLNPNQEKFDNFIAKRRKKRKTKKLVRSIIALVIIPLILGIFGAQAISRVEKYSTQAKYQFMQDLESGNEEAMALYKRDYIDKNEYLYNGDITLKLMAEKFNIDFEVLKSFYNTTSLESLQELHDKYLVDINIVKFLQKCSKDLGGDKA